MGSLDEPQVVGQYMHPVIDEQTRDDDPWQRNYFAPPAMKNLVPRNYPLKDMRVLLADYSAADMLKSHGFGVVKHESGFLQQLSGEITEDAIVDQYHPEIRKLVLETTGAKEMFISVSVFRRGKDKAEAFKLPTQVSTAKSAVTQAASKSAKDDGVVTADKAAQSGKPPTPPRLGLAAPVRIPHMDFTPLGARQSIRSQSKAIYDAAVESGVLAAEDEICKSHGLNAATKEADHLIAERYNAKGLGPRYAAYSIWRPIKKVQRDPITLVPTGKMTKARGEFVDWSYENKIPGIPELGGDYLKQFAMLGVKSETAPEGDSPLDFYYISNQEANEVLFIKLFDSASLGSESEHAGAPWHASPEIGEVEGTEARESIDVRVLVFW